MTFKLKVILFRILFIISTIILISFIWNNKIDYLLISIVSLIPVSIHTFQSVELNSCWFEVKRAYFFSLFVKTYVIPYSDVKSVEQGFYNSEIESLASYDASFLDLLFGLFRYQLKYKTTRIRTIHIRPLNLIEVKYDLNFHFDLEKKVLGNKKEHDINK